MGLPRQRIWAEDGGGLGTNTRGLYRVQQSEEEERVTESQERMLPRSREFSRGSK